MSTLYYESSFAHHGVKGQKWGVRRYQNPDGTLTAKGRTRSRASSNDHSEYLHDGVFSVNSRLKYVSKTMDKSEKAKQDLTSKMDNAVKSIVLSKDATNDHRKIAKRELPKYADYIKKNSSRMNPEIYSEAANSIIRTSKYFSNGENVQAMRESGYYTLLVDRWTNNDTIDSRFRLNENEVSKYSNKKR